MDDSQRRFRVSALGWASMRRLRSELVVLVIAGVVAMSAIACAAIPTLTFEADGTDAAGDAAATPEDATSGDDGSVDAGPPSSDAPASDSAVDDPPDTGLLHIACGTGQVTTCARCAGLPFRCINAGRDECVSDCSACHARWLPCLHCQANGTPFGRCVAVAGGKLACGDQNRCPCTTATSCPTVAGGALTCMHHADGGGPLDCFTCGENGSGTQACVGDGVKTGTCKVNGGAPVCK